jgi:hypothetical protein
MPARSIDAFCYPRDYVITPLPLLLGLEWTKQAEVLYQGTTLQLAEKLGFLKGTSFSPYVSD